MKIFKVLLFFLLLPIYGTMTVVMHFSYEWWQDLLDK